jgi:hypothetical protein
MARLRAKIQPIAEITMSEKEEMLAIFKQYYELPNEANFYRDFDSKDHVIVLREKSTAAIKGFSTQKILKHEIQGKTYTGVFSGDTIIDREFWGDYTLTWAFAWYLTRLCLPWPWKKVYWHLISKGYKTYLLMANNFTTFYPCHSSQTPPFFQALTDDFARQLYPQTFDRKSGLIVFDGPHEHLKDSVAPIRPELTQKHPHVRFFVERNPQWERGDELVCVGEYHLGLPFKLVFKLCTRLLRKVFLPKSIPAR